MTVKSDQDTRFIIAVVRKSYRDLPGEWWQKKNINQYHVTAIHLLMYFMRKYTHKSMADIGEVCGGRTEGAVLAGLRKIESKATGVRFGKRMETIDKKLRSKFIHGQKLNQYKRKGYRPIDENAILPPHIESELSVIWNIACEQYGYFCDPKIMSRRLEFTQVRFLFYYLAYDTGYFTLVQLAAYTSKRDHSSVINGRDKIADLLYITPNGRPVDPELYRRVLTAQSIMNTNAERSLMKSFEELFSKTEYLTSGYL